MQAIEDIKQKVDAFLAKTSMAPSTFGIRAVKSGHFVTALRNGRTPRAPTLAKVDAYIRGQEAELQRALGKAIAAIKCGDGYVQVNTAGEPVNLPKGVEDYTFRQLVTSGQLQPSGDSFLGGRAQTFRPI